jgi:hypothetical protein
MTTMTRMRSAIQCATLLSFTVGLIPVLGGGDSSDSSSTTVAKPDPAKAKAAEEATAAAFKEAQKSHKGKK